MSRSNALKVNMIKNLKYLSLLIISCTQYSNHKMHSNFLYKLEDPQNPCFISALHNIQKNGIADSELKSKVEDLLIDHFDSVNLGLQNKIVQTLGNLKSKKSFEVLTQKLSEKNLDKGLKENIISTILNIGDKKAVDYLIQLINNEKDDNISLKTIKSLYEIINKNQQLEFMWFYVILSDEKKKNEIRIWAYKCLHKIEDTYLDETTEGILNNEKNFELRKEISKIKGKEQKIILNKNQNKDKKASTLENKPFNIFKRKNNNKDHKFHQKIKHSEIKPFFPNEKDKSCKNTNFGVFLKISETNSTENEYKPQNLENINETPTKKNNKNDNVSNLNSINNTITNNNKNNLTLKEKIGTSFFSLFGTILTIFSAGLKEYGTCSASTIICLQVPGISCGLTCLCGSCSYFLYKKNICKCGLNQSNDNECCGIPLLHITSSMQNNNQEGQITLSQWMHENNLGYLYKKINHDGGFNNNLEIFIEQSNYDFIRLCNLSGLKIGEKSLLLKAKTKYLNDKRKRDNVKKRDDILILKKKKFFSI